jgi:hypothetical protein
VVFGTTVEKLYDNGLPFAGMRNDGQNRSNIPHKTVIGSYGDGSPPEQRTGEAYYDYVCPECDSIVLSIHCTNPSEREKRSLGTSLNLERLDGASGHASRIKFYSRRRRTSTVCAFRGNLATRTAAAQA